MRGTFLGVPKINNEDYSIWGSILGSLIYQVLIVWKGFRPAWS